MGRRRSRVDQKAVTEKATEIKDAAKEIAGTGGEAVRDFVQTTGSAAREFATSTAQAAKELLESTERALERLNGKAEPRRKGRKFVRATLAFGVAAGLLANEKVRRGLASALRKSRRREELPWNEPEMSAEVRQQTPSGITP